MLLSVKRCSAAGLLTVLMQTIITNKPALDIKQVWWLYIFISQPIILIVMTLREDTSDAMTVVWKINTA